MSIFQYKLNHNEIYLHQNMITNIKADAIVHFIDSNDNKFALEIFQKGGHSLKEEFYKKLPKIYDFNSLIITNGGALTCKHVIHTTSFIHKPDTEGYFDAIRKKILQCLNEAKSQKFKSLAFPVNQSGYIGDIILKSYYEVLTSYNGDYPGQIHCACADNCLFERFKNMFFKSDLSLGQPQNPALGHQTNYQKFPAATGAAATEETPMDVDMPDATETNDSCPICLCDFTGKKTLDKCGHSFCSACIDHSFSVVGPSCPVCQTIYGKISGQQPPGIMSIKREFYSLPGFSGCGTYVLDYYIPDGTQKKEHPNPGKRFYGTSRTAYLPANKEGETVLKMLQKAFVQKLIFTVGTSKTSNMKNTVTWNDIHHKTCIYGGPFEFGYPDPDYLERVSSELEAKGVTAKSVAHERIVYSLESK